MNSDAVIDARRAIEALRAGVPSGHAVGRLGCSHPQVEQRFNDLLEATSHAAVGSKQADGLLVTGGFGSGKSHLLEYLRYLALEQQFVVSKIVVSKETSLANPLRVFRAAAAEMVVPGQVGPGISSLSRSLRYDSPAYSEFFRWAGSPESELVPQFAASLTVAEYDPGTEEAYKAERFWAGDRILIGELKTTLRNLGQGTAYTFPKAPSQASLALQRLRFVSRLIQAAGYAGWLILLDEVELISQYTIRQRGKAYQELARLCGQLTDRHDGNFPGLMTVAAITTDFESAVLRGAERNDLDQVPNRLRAGGTDEEGQVADNAEKGMQFILRGGLPLKRPERDELAGVHDELRRMYSDAYSWPTPALHNERPGTIETTTVMRTLVRRWITSWDLRRFYPEVVPELEETPISLSDPSRYAEDRDLERAADGDDE